MAEEIRVNRPQSQPQSMGQAPVMVQHDNISQQYHGGSGSGRSRIPWIVLGLVILAVIVALVLFRDRLFPAKGSVQGVTTSEVSEYQAVFLSNGQVYFGKITNENNLYTTIRDIYYLQVTPLQGTGTENQQQQQQLQLVKLGNELHGPVDEMQINRDHILFREELKNDGRVVKAIQEYQKNPTAPSAQQQNSTNQAPATNPPATTNTDTGR